MQGLSVNSPLTHWYYSVFMTEADPTSWIEGWPVMLGFGNTGRIDRLTFPLEPSLPDIEFLRVHAASVRFPAKAATQIDNTLRRSRGGVGP